MGFRLTPLPLLRRVQPTVILQDLVMPEVDGIESWKFPDGTLGDAPEDHQPEHRLLLAVLAEHAHHDRC